ncbi:hypothetical protein ACVXHB_13320 [Escherichia coli]
MQAKGTLRLDKHARPLLLIEIQNPFTPPLRLSSRLASVELLAIAAHRHHHGRVAFGQRR